jgi:hypothetical protein
MDQIRDVLSELKIENFHLISAVVLVISLIWFLRSDYEQAVNIVVPEPPQCQQSWKGKILKSPSIKVILLNLNIIP